MSDDKAIEQIRSVVGSFPTVLFAVLIGSRAAGTAHHESDWDIAVRWKFEVSPLQRVEGTECLRMAIAAALGVSDTKVDLVDLANASLVMCAVVAEEGVPLCGDDSLDWARFLTTTWRELEDYYWAKQHAA